MHSAKTNSRKLKQFSVLMTDPFYVKDARHKCFEVLFIETHISSPFFIISLFYDTHISPPFVTLTLKSKLLVIILIP